MDVYRQNTLQDADEFRPFRGNIFTTQKRDSTTLIGGYGGEILTNVDGPVYQKFKHKVNNPSTHGVSQDPVEVTDSVLTIMTNDPNGNNNASPDGKSDIPGRVQWREVTTAVATDNLDERRNYKTADYINYLEGDVMSSIYYTEGEGAYDDKSDKLMYEYAKTSLVNDKARVFKGGSWRDRAYFLNPGTRRYLDQRQANAWLGFRCAMTRVGSPVGFGK
jgi:hypothetical protein